MSTPIPSPDPLRAFLRDHFTAERLHRIASADYGRHANTIAAEFKHNLDTGQYAYTGDGNPYECSLLQRHDTTPDRPLNELFGAWGLGTFCSEPENFVLINNLIPNGVDAILHMLVRGAAELGPDAHQAARAALPFAKFLHARTPHATDASFAEATAALEAIKHLGPAATKAWQYQTFTAKFDKPNDA